MKMQRSFYLPRNAEMFEKTKLMEVYTAINNGQLEAVGFSGKRQKPDFHYIFKSVEQFKKYYDKYYSKIAQLEIDKQSQKDKRRLERDQFLKKLIPGAILYTSWGYDQTRYDFYQVQKVVGSKVTLQQLCKAQVDDETNCWSYWKVKPIKDSFKGEPFNTIVRSPWITINSYNSLSSFHEEGKTYGESGHH